MKKPAYLEDRTNTGIPAESVSSPQQKTAMRSTDRQHRTLLAVSEAIVSHPAPLRRPA